MIKKLIKYGATIIALFCNNLYISPQGKIDMKSIIGVYKLPKNSLAVLINDSLVRIFDIPIIIDLTEQRIDDYSEQYRMRSREFGWSDWSFDSLSNQITLNKRDVYIIDNELLPLLDHQKRIIRQIDEISSLPSVDSLSIDSLKKEYDRYFIQYFLYTTTGKKDMWGTLQLEVIDSNTLRIVDPIGLCQLGVDTLMKVIRANPNEELYFKRCSR